MDELFGYIMALARVEEIDKELTKPVQRDTYSHYQKLERLTAEREELMDKYHITEHNFNRSSHNPGRPASISITINF